MHKKINEIQEILKKKQKFMTNALKLLEKDKYEESIMYLNMDISLNIEISNILKEKIK